MPGFLKVALATGLIALLAGRAAAQVPAVHPGMTMGVPVAMLGDAVVQEELKLDESQIQKSKVLIEATRQKAYANRDRLLELPEQERGPKHKELQRAMNEEAMKKAGEFLGPEQHARLYQLEIQRRGFNAFFDPVITGKLGISGEQGEQIKSIVDGDQVALRALLDAAAEGKARMPRVAVLREMTLVRIVGILTDDQKRKWKEMTGEHFEFLPANAAH